jgi:hypothetical protein
MMMLRRHTTGTLALLFLLVNIFPGVLAAQALLPDVTPPYQAKDAAAQKPQLKIGSFVKDQVTYEQPAFWIGNKRIGMREFDGKYLVDRDQMLGLFVDQRLIMNITFWGSIKGRTGVGYPFANIKDDPDQLIADTATQTITYRKPYLLPDGKRAVFTHTLHSDEGSKLILEWDMGITQEQLDTYGNAITLAPWFIFNKNYREQPIDINGKAVVFAPQDKLTTTATDVLRGNDLAFTYAPNSPLQQFSFTTSKYLNFDMKEKVQKLNTDRMEMIIRTWNRKPVSNDQVTLDFGLTAKADADAPPPVGNVDFWQRDRMHLQAPITRNIMPNPSFEQGLRYWNWWWGGGQYTPSDIPAYSLADEGYVGQHSLLIQPVPTRQSIMSFSIPVKKKTTYTISFYAKADIADQLFTFGVFCPLRGSQYNYQHAFGIRHKTSLEWKRYSFEYDSDQLALCLMANGIGNGKLWIDSIQIEEATKPTDYTSPSVEGRLLTSNPDNTLEKGALIDARFALAGHPGLAGQVQLRLTNVYREVCFSDDLSFTLDSQGQAVLPLAMSADKLGEGVYVLQAKYVVNNLPSYCDYYRMDIMASLENRHPTKNLYGTLSHATRITRGDDMCQRLMRWGLGSTSYNGETQFYHDLLEKYRISNMLCIAKDTIRGEQGDLLAHLKKDMTVLPDDIEQRIEQAAYDSAMARPWETHWALSTEIEGAPIIREKRFRELADRIMIPAYRGFKRANPNNIVYPDGGTSGYSVTRGFNQMEGYLKETQGKVKWDAIAVHPYWNLDGAGGTNDWDAETKRLIDQMARYGYGPETPIDFTECFNVQPMDIPEWGADMWGDTYLSGKPSYDWGWREYLHASWISRMFVMSLKYWPHLRSTNIWISRPQLDLYLSPLAMCKVPNTLGHLLPKPKFFADIRPMGGIRGYAFEDEQGRAVIAIWCAIDRVEEGTERGPQMLVDFAGKAPQFIDMMGNTRTAPTEKGLTSLQLAPAPIFMVGEKGSVNRLVKALGRADIIGASNTLNIAVKPTLEGKVEAQLKNQTNRKLTGKLMLKDQSVDYSVEPKQSRSYVVSQSTNKDSGKMFSWSDLIRIKQDQGPAFTVPWNMNYFHVPHVNSPLPADPASPLWDAIPGIKMDNVFIQKQLAKESVKGGYPGDLDVTYQMAWDKDNLYLRIHAKDDKVVLTDPSRWNKEQLYMHDGCVEIYFDTTANARSSQNKGFDLDDYRYDFYAGSSKAENGPGTIYRFYEPNMQYAGGLEMPTKQQAAKGITCQYQRTADGYDYVMIFPAWYLEPMALEQGYLASFGMFIHDIDDLANAWPRKGISLATESGAHCDRRPDLWPIMILSK